MSLSMNTDAPSVNPAVIIPNKFRCPYCHKVYARESWFRKHTCDKKLRFEQVHNMDFIRGHHIYTHWLRRNRWMRRGKEPSAADFINSPFYTPFMELVKFTGDNWVITSLRYLDYLIDHNVGQVKWCSEDTLRSYRDHIRRHDDPTDQVRVSADAIEKWCEKNNVIMREFFAKIGPGTALQMVVTGQVSPWVLFGYDRSVNDLLSRMNGDWISSVNEFLNNNYWINRLQHAPDVRTAIQTECERLFQDG